MTRPHLAPLSQGIYYVTSGLWPVVNLRRFEVVTGPKSDRWLVRTFGALVTVVGAALVAGAFDPRRPRSLAVADVVFASRGRISPVYYGDAVAEAAVAVAWAVMRK